MTLYDNAGDVVNAGANEYLYDAAGNRVAKGTILTWSCDFSQPGSFTQTAGYVVGSSGEQLTEVDANNNWVHTNVYAGGKQIGTYDVQGLHLYIDDPLGTRRVQVDDITRTVEASYQSLPFGDGLVQNAVTTTDDPTENHYTGKERDTESGNDYFGARYYNSATGRFLSPDWSAKVQPVPYAKLGDPQTLNLYAYVGNNPLNRTDPTGHYTISCGDGSKNCNQKELDLINKRISKDQTSKDPKVAAAAQAYGNLGDKGVAITVVDHVSAENGNIHGHTGAAPGTPGFTVDATGKVTGVATAITLQAGLGTGDLARAVDHEGSHAEDRNTYVGALMKDPTIPADGEAEKSLNITHRESEVNAYTVNGYTPGDIQKTLSSPPYSTDTHIDEPEFPMPTSH